MRSVIAWIVFVAANAGAMVPVPTSVDTPMRCDGDRTPAEEGYPAPGPYIVTWHVWDLPLRP